MKTHLLRKADETIQTVVFYATQPQIEEIAARAGIRPHPVELSDSGYAFHEAGPSILERMAPPGTRPPDWDTLSAEERSGVVMMAAESPNWGQGDLDPYRQDQLMEEHPGLMQRFTTREKGMAD